MLSQASCLQCKPGLLFEQGSLGAESAPPPLFSVGSLDAQLPENSKLVSAFFLPFYHSCSCKVTQQQTTVGCPMCSNNDNMNTYSKRAGGAAWLKHSICLCFLDCWTDNGNFPIGSPIPWGIMIERLITTDKMDREPVSPCKREKLLNYKVSDD